MSSVASSVHATTMKQSVNSTYPSEVEFEFRVFVKELVVMLLFSFLGPLSLPILYSLIGQGGIQQRSFWGAKSPVQFCLWLLTAVCIMLFPWCTPPICNVILWTAFVVCSRCVMIATKYACMSDKYYRLTSEHSQQTFTVLARQQLILSWSRLSSQTCQEELDISMKRNNVTIQTLTLAQFHHNLRDDVCLPEPPQTFNGYDVALSWLHTASRRFYVRHAIARTVAFGVAISPVLCYVINRQSSTTSVAPSGSESRADLTVLICSALTVWVVESGHFGFLMIALSDVRRRLFLMQHCTVYIAPSHSYLRQTSALKRLGCEAMDLLEHNAPTVHAWVNLRRILVDFGKDYVYRLSMYYSISLLMVFLAAVCVFVQVIVAGQVDLLSVFNVPMLTMGTTTLLLVTILVHFGTCVNRESIVQADVLLEYTRNVEHRLALGRATMDEAEYHGLMVTNLALQSAREQLRVDVDLRPFKVLGMAANTVIIKVIASITVSYALLLMRMSSSSSSSMNP